MIVVNKGKNRIMITSNWHADPYGGPAIVDTTFSLMPGEKIDLSILGVEQDASDQFAVYLSDLIRTRSEVFDELKTVKEHLEIAKSALKSMELHKVGNLEDCFAHKEECANALRDIE